MEREREWVFLGWPHTHTHRHMHTQKTRLSRYEKKKNPSLQHFTHKTELINFLCAFCTFLFNECDR